MKSLINLITGFVLVAFPLFVQAADVVPQQVKDIVFSNRTSTSVDITWTNGDQGERLIVMSTSPITHIPGSEQAYIGNSSFGSGDELSLASGEFAIYNGNGNSVTVNGLSPNANYYVQGFEYASTISYLTGTAAGNPSATIPTSQSTNITFSNVDNSSVTIDFDAGGGDNHLVVIRDATTPEQAPVDGQNYNSATEFGSGDATGTGNYVVYNGTGSSVSVSGLSTLTSYTVTVYDFNTASYLTPGVTANFTTASSIPTTQSTNITFSNKTYNSVVINFIPGSGNNHLVVMRDAGYTVAQTPVTGTSYGAVSHFGSGQEVGPTKSGNYAVYNGNGSNVVVSGLKNSTEYIVSVYDFYESTHDYLTTQVTGNPNSFTTSAISAADSLALVAIYNATNGPSWTTSTNWLTGNLADWYGVSVYLGRVTNLDLSANNLSGTLPVGIGDLTGLEILNLSGNQLSGPIPSALSSLINLYDLRLNDNQLTDAVPDLSGLSGLSTLLLQNNDLTDLPNLLGGSISTLDVHFNLFTFDDLEPNLSISSFTYAPQKEVTVSNTTVFFQSGGPLALSAEVGGSNNLYQWYKGTEVIDGGNSDTYSVAEAGVEDEGIYHLEITSNTVSGLTLKSQDILVLLAASVTDSTALVDLYNSTNGGSWTHNDNWLTGTVNTWYGVTLEGGKVTTLKLDNNNLSGSIPTSIGDLTDLVELDLTGNQLTGPIPLQITGLSTLERLFLGANQLSGAVPDLSSMSALSGVELLDNNLTSLPVLTGGFTLNVRNNFFTFGDLEGNISLLSSVSDYSPQKKIPVTTPVAVLPGNPLNLSLTVGGANNTYQWYRNSAPVGTNNKSYTVASAASIDVGTYYLQVNNSIVSGLTLQSEDILVKLLPTVTLSDSLALVSFYNSTNGPTDWTTKTNWLTGAVSTWFGVTVINNRVVDLGMPNNNVTGTFPPNFTNLTGLQTLFLNSNQLNGAFPNFAAMPQLTNVLMAFNNLTDLPNVSATSFPLDVRSNLLTFEDLEPNAGLIGLKYSPQKNVQVANNAITIKAGDPLTVTKTIGGSANSYQWYKNFGVIGGATNSTYSVASASTTDAGTYYLQATSSLVSGLTLQTDNVVVQVSPHVIASDSLALVALYNSTNGAGWTTQTNWLTGYVNTWQGVTVTGNRVTSIIINSNNLSGSLPVEIGNLTALTQLNLGLNKISGPIPSEVYNLTALQFLRLYQNSFTGGLSSQIAKLTALKTLTLFENQLSGDLPAELWNLPVLSNIYIRDNQFTGTIPGAIKNLPLFQFIISNNKFTGTIPVEIGTLTGMTSSLLLNGNQFTGSLPASINNLVSVPTIDVSNNQLSGSIPPLTNLSILTDLNISNNKFTDLPNLSSLSVLTSLTANNNKFTFEDLEPNISIPNFKYDSQDSIGVKSNFTRFLKEAITFTNSQPGTANKYQWKKNDVAISGANSSDLAFTSLTANDEATYRLEVTNTIATGLVLQGKPIQLTVSSLRRDSLALAALYDSASGPGWTNKTNWMTGPFKNWFGITIANNKVVGLALSSNNLKGIVPSHLLTMDGLKSIDVSGNKIKYVPNFTSLAGITSLKLQNNQLDFGALEPNVGISGINYVPQDSVDIRESYLKQLNESQTFKATIGGTANAYQWKKNATAIPAATTASLAVNAISFADDATYSYEATSSKVAGLKLISRPKIIRVSSLKRDSIALRALYLSTGGANWTNKTNWVTTALSKTAWFGVTIANNRVTSVSLPNNNLAGKVPVVLGDIANMTSLNLSSNKIQSLPDLKSLSALTTLNVSGNQLDFASLIPNVKITGINYASQADIGSAVNDLIDFGKEYSVKVSTKGAGNVYQWKRNGTAVAGAADSTYFIKSINRNNMGEYVAEITNPAVPGLTLKSAKKNVLAIATLSGKLSANSTTVAKKGKVTLFRVVKGSGYDTIAVKNINADGSFLFDKVVLDDYQVLGFIDTVTYAKALPTYYQSTIYWEEATTLPVNENISDVNITSMFKPTDTPKGTGVISGYLEQDDGKGGRTNKSERVENAGASVRRVERTGRPQGETYTLVAYVFSNAQGEFEIPNLPKGEYRLNIQYPGYPMDETSFTTVIIGDALASQVHVAATVKEGKISVKKLVVTGVWEEEGYIAEAYPNPSVDFVNVKFKEVSSSRSLELLDAAGRSMVTKPAAEKENSLDVQSYAPGVYMLRVSDQNALVKILRIVIE